MPLTSSARAGTSEWILARQALSALRAPEHWYQHVREVVSVRDDELFRSVRIRLAEQIPDQADTDEILVALQTPRKDTLVDIELDQQTAASGELLSHEEHARLTRLMLAVRFRSYLALAVEVSKNPARLRVRAQRTVISLAGLVDRDAESRSNPASLLDLFKDGYLRGYPKGRQGSELRQEHQSLFALSQLVVDRYFRFLRVKKVKLEQLSIGYSYSQEREPRSYGTRLTRVLRRWFRAPASLLLVHAPLARLTPHYEIKLDAVPGYYVHEQFVLLSGERPDGRNETAANNRDRPASHDETWWSTRSGGRTSGYMFVGNGHLSNVRIYGAFRLLELPPGATGRAFAGTFLGSLILGLVITWSLLHDSSQSSFAPSLLVALVALGSAALDNTTVKRELFNAPLLPRFALFTQTVLAILTAIWLLTRSSAEAMISMGDSTLLSVASILTEMEWWIGFTFAASSLVLLGIISKKTYDASRAYDRSMTDPKFSVDIS